MSATERMVFISALALMYGWRAHNCQIPPYNVFDFYSCNMWSRHFWLNDKQLIWRNKFVCANRSFVRISSWQLVDSMTNQRKTTPKNLFSFRCFFHCAAAAHLNFVAAPAEKSAATKHDDGNSLARNRINNLTFRSVINNEANILLAAFLSF